MDLIRVARLGRVRYLFSQASIFDLILSIRKLKEEPLRVEEERGKPMWEPKLLVRGILKETWRLFFQSAVVFGEQRILDLERLILCLEILDKNEKILFMVKMKEEFVLVMRMTSSAQNR